MEKISIDVSLDINADIVRVQRLDKQIWSTDSDSILFNVKVTREGQEITFPDGTVVEYLLTYGKSKYIETATLPVEVDRFELPFNSGTIVQNDNATIIARLISPEGTSFDLRGFTFKVAVSEMTRTLSDIEPYALGSFADLMKEIKSKSDQYFNQLPSLDQLKGKDGVDAKVKVFNSVADLKSYVGANPESDELLGVTFND